ncbi:Alpha/Beta hydrolase protein [Xylariaceae sp. FL0016]|nr:Alpha/Beta hydrolase protein [Xylariaceae sp. FL0016]
MQQLPRPSLSFTLPSIHDGTRLDCRVYHPARLHDPASAAAAGTGSGKRDGAWRRHVAVVAHPYAPLGGCFDDPVVGVVAGCLLELGFVVGTFNFRGASSSGGRTSWTSKPERADYMSMVGFMAYYVHYLDPFPSPSSSSSERNNNHKTLPITTTPPLPPPPPPRIPPPQETKAPTMLLAGYSYGAMVTTELEALDAVLAPFASPAVGTCAADIRLRAQHLAEQQNAVFAAPLSSPRKSLGMRVGGGDDEGEGAGAGHGPRRSHDHHLNLNLHLHRKSHDRDRDGGNRDRNGDKTGQQRRAAPSPRREREDRIRGGVVELLARTRLIRRRRYVLPEPTDYDHTLEHEEEVQYLEPAEGFQRQRGGYREAYLAVSPPVGVVTSLATMSFANPFASVSSAFALMGLGGRNRGRRGAKEREQAQEQEQRQGENVAGNEVEDEEGAESGKLVRNPALVIYGDQDGFVSLRRMREWCGSLARERDTGFRCVEVAGAGHFWVEGGAVGKMAEAVRAFAGVLLGD